MGEQRLLNFRAEDGAVDMVTIIDAQSGETRQLRPEHKSEFDDEDARPAHDLVGVAAMPVIGDDPGRYEFAKRVYLSATDGQWWTEDIEAEGSAGGGDD